MKILANKLVELEIQPIDRLKRYDFIRPNEIKPTAIRLVIKPTPTVIPHVVKPESNT